MTNLTRFNPFNELVRFDPVAGWDDFFVFPRMPVVRSMPTEPEIKMDLTEDERAFYVKADIPGVKKEDIKVGIEGNEISISAEVNKTSEEKKGETVLRSERYYGRCARSFTLDTEVDEAKSEAKYADGVLMLTLPKKGGRTVKQVAIN